MAAYFSKNKSDVNHQIWYQRVVSLSIALAFGWGDLETAYAEQVKTIRLPGLQVTNSKLFDYDTSDQYRVDRSSAATGLNMSIKDTPQAVSVTTREMMDDFSLNNINDVLATTSAVTVEKIETDRTYYTARGYDITNFQIDGIGLPFTYGLVKGDIDTAVYDRVETIRGANGLMSGTGNPSATVNFVRKRPTDSFKAFAGLTLGSWNQQRLQADIGGPINAAGTLRGRVVVVDSRGDSYLDRYHHEKKVFYGIVEADLTSNTTLAVGHTRQNNDVDSPLWGALPLYYSNGTATDYDVSTSTAPDWSYWNTRDKKTFAELTHYFANDWQVKAVVTRTRHDEPTKLFYVSGTPDPATGLGLTGYASKYYDTNIRKQADLRASGPFELAGRQHELLFGVSWAKSTTKELSEPESSSFDGTMPDLATWDGSFDEPAFTGATSGGGFTDRYKSAYLASRINLSDTLKFTVGGRYTQVKSAGIDYGEDKYRDDSAITPYAGLVYQLTPTVSTYASYTHIFNPQNELDQATLRTIKPVEGRSLEAGIKSDLFNKRALASFSVFRIHQDNLATYIDSVYSAERGMFVDLYTGQDSTSTGMEMELAGRINDDWNMSASYTVFRLKNDNGGDARTFLPRQQFKLLTTYRLPTLPRLKLGASMRWQSDIKTDQGAGIVTQQDAYAVVDLMASYIINDNWKISAHLNNVTNKKYLNSLYWSQSYYAAPRNGSVTLNYQF